jgi:hypothetical protein
VECESPLNDLGSPLPRLRPLVLRVTRCAAAFSDRLPSPNAHEVKGPCILACRQNRSSTDAVCRSHAWLIIAVYEITRGPLYSLILVLRPCSLSRAVAPSGRAAESEARTRNSSHTPAMDGAQTRVCLRACSHATADWLRAPPALLFPSLASEGAPTLLTIDVLKCLRWWLRFRARCSSATEPAHDGPPSRLPPVSPRLPSLLLPPRAPSRCNVSLPGHRPLTQVVRREIVSCAVIWLLASVRFLLSTLLSQAR